MLRSMCQAAERRMIAQLVQARGGPNWNCICIRQHSRIWHLRGRLARTIRSWLTTKILLFFTTSLRVHFYKLCWALSQDTSGPVKSAFCVMALGKWDYALSSVCSVPSTTATVSACSTCHRSCHLNNLFDEMGKLSSRKEVKTIELAAGGLLFTGDGAGELKVLRWAPQDEEERRTPAPA